MQKFRADNNSRKRKKFGDKNIQKQWPIKNYITENNWKHCTDNI